MKNYLPVNWVDGMKINKTHFIAEANAHLQTQMMGIASLLNSSDYGLLPNRQADGGNVLFLSTDNHSFVELRLKSCHAVTSNGYLIHIATEGNDTTGQQLHIPVSPLRISGEDYSSLDTDNTMGYYVVLQVKPFERIPYGPLDSEEIPPRLPYTIPSISLMLMPTVQMDNATDLSNILPIGKLTLQGNTYSLDEQYVPPCHSVASSPVLQSRFENWKIFLGRMELLCQSIIQKVNQKKQENTLSIPIVKMSEWILQYLSGMIDSFKLNGETMSPSFIIGKMAGLSRIIKNSLDLYIGTGKEEVFAYFNEYCGIEQGAYEKTLMILCHTLYRHYDCMIAVSQVDTFVAQTKTLFEALAALDYIGKRKDIGIFVKEQAITMDKPKRLGNFLVD